MAKSFPIFDLILLCFPDERSILSTSNNVTKLTSFIWSNNWDELVHITNSENDKPSKIIRYAGRIHKTPSEPVSRNHSERLGGKVYVHEK